MTTTDPSTLDECLGRVARRLLERRSAPDRWDGHLASSALSTGTAVLALHLTAQRRGSAGEPLERLVQAGVRWLIANQNDDGGWGDTARSRTNISTTAIVWAALSLVGRGDAPVATAVARAGAWLTEAAGGPGAEALRIAILKRYGKDQTFSVPILTVLALTGKLGDDGDAWRLVPQLPFELAAVPHGWFQHLALPVVSYALPALIAIGQVRHRRAPSRNPLARSLRDRVGPRTHRVLIDMQPASGGYLEATPLTSFVVMSLVGAGLAGSPVVESGVTFLADSIRTDGSWPIDTNLSTWVSTLAIGALADAGALPEADRLAMRRWLIGQQSTREHPFTHAAAGAWAWTPLSGGVPDADDTSGALIALRQLGDPDPEVVAGATAGVRWLLGVQNRDGGVPTFCRGWGTLPFDRSTPEITAHALRAWSAWFEHLDPTLRRTAEEAARCALDYLASTQRSDGTWIPLWFGNEHAADDDNPVYGTARVLLGLESSLVHDRPAAERCRRRATAWLLHSQNVDGGWGGNRGVRSSMEETGVAVAALGGLPAGDDRLAAALQRGAEWLMEAVDDKQSAPSPLGLYFARLWYYEELYPLIFALEGLARARRHGSVSSANQPGSLPSADDVDLRHRDV